MKKKCDRCDKPATIHLTEIVGSEKTEKHLCEDCAVAEGITIKANVPISQLLEDFVLQTTSEVEASPDLKCDVCGMTFAEFREHGHLGCPNDYEAFSEALVPMLVQVHEGADQHLGKVPRHAGAVQRKQNALLRLRAQLKQAVQKEQYERAADLRDQIKEIETQ